MNEFFKSLLFSLLFSLLMVILMLPVTLVFVEKAKLTKENGILKAQNVELTLKLNRFCHE